MEKVRNKVRKVKRPICNWYHMLRDLEDSVLNSRFLIFLSDHKGMSYNRIAYNVLKKYYSTTSLNRVRWLGVSLADEPRKKVNDDDLFSPPICFGSRL